MFDAVRIHGFMPEEIYSDKGKTADDCYLAKFILYDIVRQAITSAAQISIDDTNFYDSIAHAIASLEFQTFGVPLGAFESMLTAIKEMELTIPENARTETRNTIAVIPSPRTLPIPHHELTSPKTSGCPEETPD